MASMFPAILIGGPKHSGKSNLSYRLQEALRRRDMMHYLLRAHPHGEGNWYYSIHPGMAKLLRERVKVDWDAAVEGYIDKLARDIERRQVPLLVDVGGKITPQNEKIAAQCSHAIVIAGDQTQLPHWSTFAESHGLLLLAELRSELRGGQMITDDGPTLRGVISGLDPKLSPDGVCFEALVERVAALFSYAPEELVRFHFAQTAVELPLNLEWPIPPSLPAHLGESQPWQVEELPVLLDSLPQGVSLGLYGRAPGWLYGALAAFAFPQPVELFDVRLGWVAPPQLIDRDEPDPRLSSLGIGEDETVQLRFKIVGDYLERDEAEWLAVPPVAGFGVILDGRIPNWLIAALARHYCQTASWLACFQPQLQGCVVIWSPSGTPAVGTLVRSLL